MKVPMKQALADRADRPDELVASGRQIEMIFKPGQKALSLRAQKVWHLLVKAAGVKLADDTAHSAPLADLYQSGLGHMTLAERVETLRELQTTLVEVLVPSLRVKGRMRIISGALLAYVSRDEDDRGELEWMFSKALRVVFANSEHWAVLSKRAVMAFESRYALRLYEIVSLRSGLEHKTHEVFDIETLRTRLGVPIGKLGRWQDVKAQALEPAIAEVNQLAGFKLSYEPIKKGRSVAAVKLSWGEKSAPERKATKRELDSPKVGRKARRAGTVETVTEAPATLPPSPGPFPGRNALRFNPAWNAIFEKNHPSPWPDREGVADRFREWCGKKTIPLNRADLPQIFAAFCKKGSAV